MNLIAYVQNNIHKIARNHDMCREKVCLEKPVKQFCFISALIKLIKETFDLILPTIFNIFSISLILMSILISIPQKIIVIITQIACKEVVHNPLFLLIFKM